MNESCQMVQDILTYHNFKYSLVPVYCKLMNQENVLIESENPTAQQITIQCRRILPAHDWVVLWEFKGCCF